MNALRAGLSVVLFSVAILFATSPSSAQLMIVGNDQKFAWDETNTRQVMPPGKDTVSIVDIGTDPAAPKIVANLPLMNSLIGPPTNLAMTPDERLAIVANSLDWVQDGASWKQVPDNKVFVIDLKMTPPVHAATLEVGRQPSGVAINRLGDLALVANRVDKSISVLSIQGREVKVVGTVTVGDEVVAVAFTPDGKRALAVKPTSHKIALLDVSGLNVTYTKYDLRVGLTPYNIDVTPNGKLAIVADLGESDGHIDTVSVIDLEATPPRVIDRVAVGDAPEGRAGSRRRSNSRGACGALPDGWCGDRPRRPDVDPGAVRRGGGGLHPRARSQPAGEQLVAGRAGVRRARGNDDGRRRLHSTVAGAGVSRRPECVAGRSQL